MGPIVLGDLEEGCCRELTRREVEALYKRCLPEDPLCPTVAQVLEILTVCFERIIRRRQIPKLSPQAPRPLPHQSGVAGVVENKGGTGMDPVQPRVDPDAGTQARSTAWKTRDPRRNAGGESVQRRWAMTGSEAVGEGVGESEHGEATGGVIRRVVEFSLRYLHEAPAGPEGDCNQPELCPGEGASLRLAQAIPPNEAHMSCGYRNSQIERLA